MIHSTTRHSARNDENKISTATNATAATILAALTNPVAPLATVAV